MPPNPDDDLPVPTEPITRRFSQYYVPQGVYLGLDVNVDSENNKVNYSMSVHDGSYTTDYYAGDFTIEPKDTTEETLKAGLEKLVDTIRMFSVSQHYKIQIVALSSDVADHIYKSSPNKTEQSIASMFWRQLDAIPFHVHTHGESGDERASAAVRKAVMWMSPKYPGNIPRVCVGYKHEVEVDFNGMIHIVELEDYQRTVQAETWRVLTEMRDKYRDRRLRVSYFNSTPQGGGVALMRHALLRLYRLLDIDCHWYVTRPKPEVFDITKRKFHNVLQGVAPPDVRLNDDDKQMFIDWSNENVERFWLGNKGPIENSDVIVIDDPQVVGIIPHIKKHNPRARIIFRSHIEMRADLIRDDPEGPQAETWNFLWQFIQHADLFIAHPMDNFIPDVVPRKNVVLMPATTDPLDGLNKSLDRWCTDYYQQVFNRVCIDQGANEVDWSRPYIVQVARFDPSKGIPDVLESYRLLREKMAANGIEEFDTPQLVICGHGSIDDPDGTIIYEQTYRTIQKPEFEAISLDIIAARLPPSDQLLDLIIRNAVCALQLSHREGFEVKVTEALYAGVPVVAYQAGGIPLQIANNQDGFLVPIGDVQSVADRLYALVTDNALRQQMSANAKKLVTEEFFTVWNAIAWLHMFLQMTDSESQKCESKGLLDVEATFQRNSGLGNETKVCELWKKQYNYQPTH
ncbi:UDP-Glycosyltransferase/glycogen phosphorylase [Lichtheimia hyalospora FSU 10163]|nr:UDP-Glycosyltransferase/glycogen phosphorylase [Lichtheimia hyalospora FSU 10163]